MPSGLNVCSSVTLDQTQSWSQIWECRHPLHADVPACQIIADIVNGLFPSEMLQTCSMQAQLEDSSIGSVAKWLKESQDRPPKSDVAEADPYCNSDATKFSGHSGLVYVSEMDWYIVFGRCQLETPLCGNYYFQRS